MTQAQGEVFVKLGLDGKKFDQGISDAKKKLALFAAEVSATIYLVDRFLERSTNAATRLTNMATASGIAATKLRQMGIAAALGNAGVKAEEASAQLAEFGKNLYSLSRWGTGNSEGFNKLSSLGRGISFYGRETVDIIQEISEKLQGLPDQDAADVLASFGMGPEMLPLMRNFNGLMEQAGTEFGRTADEIDNLKNADKTIAHFKITLSEFATDVVSTIAPSIMALDKAISDLGKNSTALDGLGIVLKSMASSLLVISSIGDTVVKGTGVITAGALHGALDHGDKEVGAALQQEIKEMDWGGSWRNTGGMLRKMWGTDGSGALPALPTPAPSSKPGANNWGNLRGDDGNFRSFSTPEDGMRAMLSDLGSKISGNSPAMRAKYGNGYTPSLANIMKVYAPAGDRNDPSAYANYVSGQTGIDTNRPLTMADLEAVTKAMAQFENNKNITINNTNNIHGENGRVNAELIGTEMERSLKRALSDQNNGAR